VDYFIFYFILLFHLCVNLMAQTAVFFGDIFKNTVDGQSNPRHSLTLSQRMVCLLAKVMGF